MVCKDGFVEMQEYPQLSHSCPVSELCHRSTCIGICPLSSCIKYLMNDSCTEYTSTHREESKGQGREGDRERVRGRKETNL